MLPAIDTQLASIRASLLDVAGRVGGDDGAELADLARALRIVERTWSRRLPVLVADSADLRRLLGDDDAAGPAWPELAEAEASHEALRATLAALIAAAGDDDEGLDLRRRATATLRGTSARQPW